MSAKTYSKIVKIVRVYKKNVKETGETVENIGNNELNEEKKSIKAVCTTACFGKTGVEMEALSGVSIALLTIYDMCKALDRAMEITDIHLLEKAGGKSGYYKKSCR